MLRALGQELMLRKEELRNEVVETIYFGGGTPSVLEQGEVDYLLGAVKEHFRVSDDPEITLEANPDDLTYEKMERLAGSKVNRLSIGIQSFFEEDLRFMNRAHNAEQARSVLDAARKSFENISIDLIYGVPTADNVRWEKNVEIALKSGVPHISSYALTVEPGTALQKFIQKGIVPDVDDEAAETQFQFLVDRLEAEGFVHYELSNFGKPGYFSRNNTAYWQGKNYLGIGPSAHSFDGHRRSWNISNNSLYIKALQKEELPSEAEVLSQRDRYNEYVMTGLRTHWGVSLQRIEKEFGGHFVEYLLQQAERHIADRYLFLDGDTLKVTRKGRFLSDGLASDLFMLPLEKKK